MHVASKHFSIETSAVREGFNFLIEQSAHFECEVLGIRLVIIQNDHFCEMVFPGLFFGPSQNYLVPRSDCSKKLLHLVVTDLLRWHIHNTVAPTLLAEINELFVVAAIPDASSSESVEEFTQ